MKNGNPRFKYSLSKITQLCCWGNLLTTITYNHTSHSDREMEEIRELNIPGSLSKVLIYLSTEISSIHTVIYTSGCTERRGRNYAEREKSAVWDTGAQSTSLGIQSGATGVTVKSFFFWSCSLSVTWMDLSTGGLTSQVFHWRSLSPGEIPRGSISTSANTNRETRPTVRKN